MKNNMTSKLFEAASSVNKGAYELSREALVESQRIVEEKSDEEIRRQLKGSKFCPRCGRRYNDYPAISRYDNKTEICPDCGVEEAMINFTGGHLSDPHVYNKETGEEINESADSDIVTIYLEINTDYDEERYRESGHSGFMPISYVTRNFKRDIAKALGHNNFKLKCVSERGPHGWPVYFVTGSVEDMKKVCGRFTADDFESSIVDDSVRDFYNKNKGRDLSPKFVSSEEINESADLTAKVTYHDKDGTRDFTAGKLSDGRYFLIGQQEQIIVSDEDLPSLAKKDMDENGYDEDFIEALVNGTTLDKNSDLAKIIINASRKYLDDESYLLSDLTAKVTYHDEDGTRDYIAGKLSDGRYFLIGQQEQIIVSDKDLPSLAKKDMNDFRYDEDGDKDFIEALENGTDLDKNSYLAKIIINASRKYLDDGGYLLSESADNISSEDKRKEIEDRIAELKLALEDEAISEDEKEDVKKEISDLENSLNECSSKENLNEDDSDDEDDDSDDEDDLDDSKEDKSLLDSDNYQDVIQFLINDENEAIDGYNKAKDRLSNLLSEDEYTKYLEVIEHIISEENEHIEELTKVLNGEPVDLNHDKESNEDEFEEITESSPVDSLDKDVMTDIEYIVKSFKEDNKSDEDILDEIKSRISDLDDGVLEDIMSSELYSFMKDNEEGKEVDFDSLISRMSDIFEEEYEEEEE